MSLSPRTSMGLQHLDRQVERIRHAARQDLWSLKWSNLTPISFAVQGGEVFTKEHYSEDEILNFRVN